MIWRTNGKWAWLAADPRFLIGIWPMGVGTRYLAQVHIGGEIEYLGGHPDKEVAKARVEEKYRELIQG